MCVTVIYSSGHVLIVSDQYFNWHPRSGDLGITRGRPRGKRLGNSPEGSDITNNPKADKGQPQLTRVNSYYNGRTTTTTWAGTESTVALYYLRYSIIR